MLLSPLTSPLFPYTTLFRSEADGRGDDWRQADADGSARRPAREPRRRACRTPLDSPACRNRLMSATFYADRKSTRLNSSHLGISYAVFCLKKKIKHVQNYTT